MGSLLCSNNGCRHKTQSVRKKNILSLTMTLLNTDHVISMYNNSKI